MNTPHRLLHGVARIANSIPRYSFLARRRSTGRSSICCAEPIQLTLLGSKHWLLLLDHFGVILATAYVLARVLVDPLEAFVSLEDLPANKLLVSQILHHLDDQVGQNGQRDRDENQKPDGSIAEQVEVCPVQALVVGD